MRWRDRMLPVRMTRVAVVTPGWLLRDTLVELADAGDVELDTLGDGRDTGPAGRVLRASGRTGTAAVLSAAPPDPAAWARDGRDDLLAGEARLEERATDAVTRGDVSALIGWAPAAALDDVSARLESHGAAIVRLPRPPGQDVPTLLPARGVRRAVAPLVGTYGTVPYADLDPTWPAWAAYVLMFGMMFGDAGHGLILLAAGLLLAAGRPARLRRFRRAWPFVVGAGVTSIGFGLLYGEAFGPTGLVPTLWLNPMDAPVTLLVVAIGLGAVLLAVAYALGAVNRWREGGWPVVLYAPSGVAGAAVFLGVGLAAGALYLRSPPLAAAGGTLAAIGLALAFTGFISEAGGGGTGVVQAVVELFDLVIRLAANAVSFARLAAFGLTHAAIGWIVWQGTTGAWRHGGIYLPLAVVLFVVGNVLAFSLEALVAAVQALRLEYYELFSRIFAVEGRPFRPWRIPVVRPSEPTEEGAPCPSG